MGLRRYLVLRIVDSVPTLLGIMILLFILTRAMPGDPVRLALGPLGSQEQVEALRHLWGLDQPIYVQFYVYFNNFIHGDWGRALTTMRPVTVDLLQFLPATIELTIVGVTLSIILGFAMGVIAANNKDKWQDHIARISSLAGVSIPTFWSGILLQFLLGYLIPVFPIVGRIGLDVQAPAHITGLYLFDSLVTLNFEAFFSSFHHILLPGFVSAFGGLANTSRLIRTTMIDERSKDYVLASKANGLPASLITYVYMLKNCSLPAITMIALTFARRLGGSILVETVFAWPGVGFYLVQAINFTDINAIIGASIIVGAAVIIAGFFTDVLHAHLDPRIKYAERSSR